MPARKLRAAQSDGSGGWLNAYPDTVTLDEARANPARPVTVYLYVTRRCARRAVLLLGDFDAKRVPAAQASADAAAYAAIFDAEGVETVHADSGPSGGVHVWAGCVEGVAEGTARRIGSAAKRLFVSFDDGPLSNPKVGAARPPGAAHRNGGYSRLTSHTIDQAVTVLGAKSPRAEAYERIAARLEAMAAERDAATRAAEPADVVDKHEHQDDEHQEAPDGRKVPKSIRDRGPVVRQLVTDAQGNPKLAVPFRPLGSAGVKTLRRRMHPRHTNHDEQVHAALRSMAVNGWRMEQAAAVLADPQASPALEWLRSRRLDEAGHREVRDEQETARLLARKWELAVLDAARMPRRPQDSGQHRPEYGETADAVRDLLARMAAAGPSRWARESGPADAAILYALAYLMLLSGTTDVSADVRRLGVLAGYSHQTAAVALYRLIADGWLTVTAEADRRAGKARRVTLATSHTCTDHHRHACATYTAQSDIPAGDTGSDRSENAAPPCPLRAIPADLAEHVRQVITHQQSDVWHALGHHAARTLRTITETPGPITLAELTAATGYRRATIIKHLRHLEALQLIRLSISKRYGYRARPGQGSRHAAAQALGTAGRIPARAVAARIDQAVNAWQRAEEEWCALSRQDKRARGRRRGPEQTVLPGMDPTGRAYPRHPHPRTSRPECGPMDHARAQAIEAERIGAAELLAAALQHAQAGEIIDVPRLTARPAQASQPPRRAVLPARHRCPQCGAEPGHPCVTWSGRRAAGWHQARRKAAGASAPQQGRTAA